MRSLERATFIATILGLVLLVGVLYLRVSDDDAPGSAAAPSPPAATAQASATPDGATPPAFGPTPASRPSGVLVNVRRENAYVWPSGGPVTSYFGPGHPTGIDIALSPDVDSPIHAAASGTVSFAGDDASGGLGLNVVIDHGGTSTVYGHLSEIDVQVGQDLAQGEVIGLGGSTGNANGKHVHFELDVDGTAVDPLRYLSVDKRSEATVGAELFACRPGSIPIEPAAIVRMSFVPMLSVDLRLESVSLDAPSAGAGAPLIDVVKDGNLAVLTVGAAPVAFGSTFSYVLRAELAQPNDVRQTVECNLELETLETFPNVLDEPDVEPDALAEGEEGAAPGGEETPLPGTDGAAPGAEEPPATTSTSTPAPGRPTAVPTATRGAPQPAAFPTATRGAPRAAAFPTATPAAPKPLSIPTSTPAAPRPAYQPTKAPTAAPR